MGGQALFFAGACFGLSLESEIGKPSDEKENGPASEDPVHIVFFRGGVPFVWTVALGERTAGPFLNWILARTNRLVANSGSSEMRFI